MNFLTKIKSKTMQKFIIKAWINNVYLFKETVVHRSFVTVVIEEQLNLARTFHLANYDSKTYSRNKQFVKALLFDTAVCYIFLSLLVCLEEKTPAFAQYCGDNPNVKTRLTPVCYGGG